MAEEDPIKQFLQNAGYLVSDDGTGHYRTTAHYRNGGNSSSLCINKNTGRFYDFGTGMGGSFADLCRLIKGEDLDDEQLLEYINKVRAMEAGVSEAPKIKIRKKYPVSCLDNLLPCYSFFKEKAGISEETQKTFRIGLATGNKMYRRYVVPIFDKNDLIGFSGRYYKDVPPPGVAKWKHLTPSAKFLFPVHLNDQIIREKGVVILVESPTDILKLWDCGIRNAVCLFGIKMSPKVLNYICSLYPLNRVFISLNNEPDNNSIGNAASRVLKSKLGRSISEEKIVIKLPPIKDFGEMTHHEVKEFWKEENI